MQYTLELVGVLGGWIGKGTTGREEDYIYFYGTGEKKQETGCLSTSQNHASGLLVTERHI